MNLINLLYFLCLSLSVSYMYSFSKIFEPIRSKILLIPYVRVPMSCPECSSFWFGLLVSFLYNPIFLNIDIFLLSNIFCGLVTHLFAGFLYKRNSINFLT